MTDGNVSENDLLISENKSTIQNNSASYSFEPPENVIASVEKFVVPTICFLGLIGNTMSFIVFAQKFLRSKSCSIFLAVRSLSDNGFLIILLIMWSSHVFELRLSHIIGLCQGTIFLTYVFGCLSVWMVVLVTIENYIRICKPFMVNTFCKTTKATYAVILVFIFLLCCYNFPLWTMTERCLPKAKHYNFLKIMGYVDSVLTLVVPTAVMTFLLSRIALSSISSCKRRRRLSSTSAQRISDLTTKVTTMLLAVTLIFITLNLPLHVVKLRLIVISFIKDKIDISTKLDIIVQSASQLIYYLSLSINFLVYYVFGGTFRKTFKSFFKRKQKNVYAQTDYSTLLSSKSRRIEHSTRPASDSGHSNNNLLKPERIEDTPLRRIQSSEI